MPRRSRLKKQVHVKKDSRLRKVKLTKANWMSLRASFYMQKMFDNDYAGSESERTRREWAWDKAFDDWLWHDDEAYVQWRNKYFVK